MNTLTLLLVLLLCASVTALTYAVYDEIWTRWVEPRAMAWLARRYERKTQP